MRKLFAVFLIFFSSFGYGQNYKLFTAYSKRLFTDSVNTFSLALDSVIVDGGDSVFYNFFGLNDTLVQSDSCGFWGGQNCYKQDQPSWVGAKILSDNAGIYYLFPNSGDTIKFDLTKNIGDTSVFYKDGIQKFSFIFEKKDTLTTLNYFDSARFYKILHTDLNNIPIVSPLNGFKIVLAKNLGMVQFFQVDSFPLLLKPLYLMGSKSPPCGMFQLTDSMIYDYQPGDEIQFHTYIYYPPPSGNGPNQSHYITYLILNRNETTDSLIYTVSVTDYDVYGWKTTIDTNMLKYYKHHVIDDIPFENYDGYVKKLCRKSYCGLNLWTYSIGLFPGSGYCKIDNCWGPADTGGPPVNQTWSYIMGLGSTWSETKMSSPPFWGYSKGADMVYFKKNGVVCDTQIVMDIDPVKELEKQILLRPNPAQERITISSPVVLNSIAILDVQGRKLHSEQGSLSTERTIYVNDLLPGIYFLQLQTDQGLVVKKVLKQ